MLLASGIDHRYSRGPKILDQVTFGFKGPGLLAVIGASGSGKTTLLGILGGIIAPVAGGTTFRGDPVANLSPTWIFQNPNVLSHRSALDNVALGGIRTGLKWKASLSTAAGLLERYGIGHVKNRKARTLSGGEVQRLVLARAEISGTALVLADEPTAQLDLENSLMIGEALLRVAQSGSTVIVATHDPSVVDTADATLSIVNGRGTYVDRR